MTTPNLFHVDVFAQGLLSGNGLSVFLHTDQWPAQSMQELTREMKQFESIFLSEICATGARARIFTVEEELPFAGHPVLGAAVVLHRTQSPQAPEATWSMQLPSGTVPVLTRRLGLHYLAEMNQGVPLFVNTPAQAELLPILKCLGLQEGDMSEGLAAQVISTGLPYLILPVQAEALARTAINGTDLETMLAALGAKFVLVVDVAARELRTWDNLGRVEDVATGSAAGPVAAYLWQAGVADPEQSITIAQGRFAGRPSKLQVRRDGADRLHVSGEVWPVAEGMLDPGLVAKLC